MHKTFASGHTVGFKQKHILDLMRIKSSIQRFDFDDLPYLLIALKANFDSLVTFTLQASLLYTTKKGLISLFGLSHFDFSTVR